MNDAEVKSKPNNFLCPWFERHLLQITACMKRGSQELQFGYTWCEWNTMDWLWRTGKAAGESILYLGAEKNIITFKGVENLCWRKGSKKNAVEVALCQRENYECTLQLMLCKTRCDPSVCAHQWRRWRISGRATAAGCWNNTQTWCTNCDGGPECHWIGDDNEGWEKVMRWHGHERKLRETSDVLWRQRLDDWRLSTQA